MQQWRLVSDVVGSDYIVNMLAVILFFLHFGFTFSLRQKYFLHVIFQQIKVHELPEGERKVRVNSLNKVSTNSVVMNYYQTGVTTPLDAATLEILMVSPLCKHYGTKLAMPT